ncbi:MFS transporter [Acrocarpospora catenulata]|uniref:MFS transporter n=1 Tax=Acrocarpospora catenulata TaxID=2836182 RepID=UPI001BD9296F|nr:MFS transporter [Acrocarpospora catenulata]
MSIRRRFILVMFLAWLPPGLMMAPQVLLMTSRGVELTEIGLIFAVYSVTVALLELPSGGLADVLGGRVVMAVSAAFTVAGLTLLALAASTEMFMAAMVLKGIARALSSGPAEAWFVNAVHAEQGPDADLKPGLAAGSVASSVALCGGVLAGGALPLVLPGEALAAPIWAGAGAGVVLLVVALVTMREPASRRASLGAVLRGVPVAVRAGFSIAVRDRGVARLLAVSAGLGVMLNAVEMLTPGRLAELTGGVKTGGTAYAVIAAVGFAANAVGGGLAPWFARRFRTSARAVIAGTLVTAVSVFGLAASVLLTGPSGLFGAGGAYFMIYAALALSEVIRMDLLHRRVAAGVRATVLSVNSLVLQAGGALSAAALGAFAATGGTGAAWAVCGAVLLLTALLYVRLPAPPGQPAATKYSQAHQSR